MEGLVDSAVLAVAQLALPGVELSDIVNPAEFAQVFEVKEMLICFRLLGQATCLYFEQFISLIRIACRGSRG